MKLGAEVLCRLSLSVNSSWVVCRLTVTILLRSPHSCSLTSASRQVPEIRVFLYPFFSTQHHTAFTSKLEKERMRMSEVVPSSLGGRENSAAPTSHFCVLCFPPAPQATSSAPQTTGLRPRAAHSQGALTHAPVAEYKSRTETSGAWGDGASAQLSPSPAKRTPCRSCQATVCFWLAPHLHVEKWAFENATWRSVNNNRQPPTLPLNLTTTLWNGSGYSSSYATGEETELRGG